MQEEGKVGGWRSGEIITLREDQQGRMDQTLPITRLTCTGRQEAERLWICGSH